MHEILDPENGLFGKKNAACNVCFPLWRYKTFFLPFLHDPNNPANNLLFAGLNKVTIILMNPANMSLFARYLCQISYYFVDLSGK